MIHSCRIVCRKKTNIIYLDKLYFLFIYKPCLLYTSRENEGDLICAAEFATRENINFMATYAKGLICTPVSYTHLDVYKRQGVDAELLMKVLGNPEMAALLNSLAKTMKV